ncbi:MAG: S8 family serine peptidase, partial [Myxococcota bacterium]
MHRRLATSMAVGLLFAASACGPNDRREASISLPGEGFLRSQLVQQWTADIPEVDAFIDIDQTEKTYRLSKDGRNFSHQLSLRPKLRMRFEQADPMVKDPTTMLPPEVVAAFGAPDLERKQAYLLQFVAQPFGPIQDHLRTLGVKLLSYYPDHAYVVQMDARLMQKVRELPYVRWVGLYHPGMKMAPALFERVSGATEERRRYSVLVAGRPDVSLPEVAKEVYLLGGDVEMQSMSRRMIVSLDDFALVELIKSKDVLFVDEATPREVDMDIARQIGGADSLELIQGYTGQGIRAEVMDSGLRTTHNDFQSNPALIHAGNGSSTSHGTSVYGIVFGDGATNAQGRGMLPDAEQPIFAAYTTLGDRMAHTARLVDPTGQYRAVFQTNSWGNARTRDYTTISAEMDEILFTQDILILQSQSNAGNQDSRPQAWAKNVLSVGGVRHGD